MWLLFIKREIDNDHPRGLEVLGKFASASLAIRKMMELESITDVMMVVNASFCPGFDDDEAAFSHYSYDAPSKERYYIRKNDPKPRKDVS